MKLRIEVHKSNFERVALDESNINLRTLAMNLSTAETHFTLSSMSHHLHIMNMSELNTIKVKLTLNSSKNIINHSFGSYKQHLFGSPRFAASKVL